jgi:hypothetical protein
MKEGTKQEKSGLTSQNWKEKRLAKECDVTALVAPKI